MVVKEKPFARGTTISSSPERVWCPSNLSLEFVDHKNCPDCESCVGAIVFSSKHKCFNGTWARTAFILRV